MIDGDGAGEGAGAQARPPGRGRAAAEAATAAAGGGSPAPAAERRARGRARGRARRGRARAGLPRRASSTALALPPGGLTDGVVAPAPAARMRDAHAHRADLRATPRSRAGRTCRRRTRSRTRAAGSRWPRSSASAARRSPGRRSRRADDRVVGAVALRLHDEPEPHGEAGYWVAARCAPRRDRDARGRAGGGAGIRGAVAALRRDRDLAGQRAVAGARPARAASREQRRELREFKGELMEFAIWRRDAAIARECAAVSVVAPRGGKSWPAPRLRESALLRGRPRATRACSRTRPPSPSARRA